VIAVGELMSNLGLFPFMSRGVLDSTIDFNNVIKSGIYTYTSLSLSINSPGNDYGILVVYAGVGYIIQEARQITNNLLVRYRSSSVVENERKWTPWRGL